MLGGPELVGGELDVVSDVGSAVVFVAGVDVGTTVDDMNVVVSGDSSLVTAAAGATSASPMPTATMRLAALLARIAQRCRPKTPRESRLSLRFSIN
jgi:hypothetical protein